MYDPTKPYKHRILKLIESTWRTPYVRVTRGIYPIFTKRFSFPEVQHTDGIGTKGFFHWKARTFKNAVQDALAMNLNDLALVGAEPYALQNHIVLPKDDHTAILEIVSALATECRKYHIAMTGGETSIHADMPGMDISITVSGFIRKPIKNKCQAGDILIGLKSNGLHSNGMTRVRAALGNRVNPEFTRPTTIYLGMILGLLKKYEVHSMMHITGGAFSKLKDILGKNDAIIEFPRSFKPRPIFYELYKRGISSKDMYTTFNCGIGFALSVAPKDANKILSEVKSSLIIGRMEKGRGEVRIKSVFDGKIIRL